MTTADVVRERALALADPGQIRTRRYASLRSAVKADVSPQSGLGNSYWPGSMASRTSRTR
jgi:hypothetical protein